MSHTATIASSALESTAAGRTGRLMSLDAFRGLTIAGMLLVNNPGDSGSAYGFLRHAEWHGWTPTDLVFPFFLFIVGVAMAFSVPRRLHQSSRTALYLQIFRRSAILFGLGLLLNLFPGFDFGNLRIAGVLQRIALVYGLAALVQLHVTVRGQAAALGSILLLYWGLLALVPVPGYGAGQLTPEGNLAAYLDQLLLPGRLYRGSWDPEGLLSTLPALATVLAGLLAGHYLRVARDRRHIPARLIGAGIPAVALGFAWNEWLPINKPLWTSSYVVFTAGAALVILGVCYWLIEIRGRTGWARPAVVYGTNAITVYVLASLFSDLLGWIEVSAGGSSISLWRWIFLSLFAPWGEPSHASLALSLAYVLLWYAVMEVFYRRRIFIKI